jgi:hypothetical protein
MRKILYLSALVGFAAIVSVKSSFAQANPADSSSQQNALNNAKALFQASLGPQSPLYNGPEYYFYDPLIKGNAYFMDINAFTQGSVFYDGALYKGVPMLYDLYSDQVVVLLYNHFSKFSLLTDRVKGFDFLDHHFININIDTISNKTSGISSGFYDELYNGKTQVLVKRSKSIQSNTGTLASERFFSPSIDYYFKKNNIYYKITSQGSLLDVLKDQKKVVQQYIKTSQIKFRRDPEDAMVKIATYYDHLTN